MQAVNNNAAETNKAEANNKPDDNLIWLDMEMSGLLPDSDRILELAVVVTDAELNVLVSHLSW